MIKWFACALLCLSLNAYGTEQNIPINYDSSQIYKDTLEALSTGNALRYALLHGLAKSRNELPAFHEAMRENLRRTRQFMQDGLPMLERMRDVDGNLPPEVTNFMRHAEERLRRSERETEEMIQSESIPNTNV
jgi:hypothetical protein